MYWFKLLLFTQFARYQCKEKTVSKYKLWILFYIYITSHIPQKFTQRQFCWSRTHVRILSHSPQFRHTLTTCRRWRSHRRVSCPVRTLCEPATWPRRHHCNHSSSVPVESTSKTVPFPPPGTIQCVHFVQQFKINSTKTLPDYIPKTDDTTEIGREVV